MTNRGSIQKGWRNIPVFGKAVVLPSSSYNNVMDLRDWLTSKGLNYKWKNRESRYEDQRAHDETAVHNDSNRVLRAMGESLQRYTTTTGERDFSKELWGMLVEEAIDKIGSMLSIYTNSIEELVQAAYEDEHGKTGYKRGMQRTALQNELMDKLVKAIMLENVDIDSEVAKIRKEYSK